MTKPKRIVNTRGGAAETPNWKFGLNADIPRAEIPELIEGLDFIAREKRGGSYFYPDYKNDKLAVAFEWYLPFRSWPFGYKVGVEFWVEPRNLQQVGAYVLYGPDHPQKGLKPTFSKSEEAAFQRRIIQTIETAIGWRSKLQSQQFFLVHYLEMPNSAVIRKTIEIPSLGAYILPTVWMGKENRPVSAVIQVVTVRFKEEAKSVGNLGATRLCALLTLATGNHYEGYRSTLGRTALKRSVTSICPMPDPGAVYPKGKFKMPLDEAHELPLEGPLRVARCYGSLVARDRSEFDRSLFAYYTAEDLVRIGFPTVAAVAMIAALKPFRGTLKCEGTVSCKKCGSTVSCEKCGSTVSCEKCGRLQFPHDIRGEASGIAASLGDLFEFPEADERRSKLEQTIKAVYGQQRSSFVHDAIFRHGEFGPRDPDVFPSQKSAISEKLVRRNQLSTIQFLTRRALLQHLHRLAGESFDPSIYGIEPQKFEAPLGSKGWFVVGSKYLTAIRVMGRM
jgi:hypothetical protein